jgi:hypothetical protein
MHATCPAHLIMQSPSASRHVSLLGPNILPSSSC